MRVNKLFDVNITVTVRVTIAKLASDEERDVC